MATYTVKLIVLGDDQASRPLKSAAEAAQTFGDAAASAGRSSGMFSEVVTGALRRVGELAANSALAAGQALLTFAANSVTVAASFEQAMAKVGAISGATETEIATLTSTARDLGATTSFSASEAAEGMQFLAMAGFDTNEVVSAMPGLLSLAAATATDLGSAADITSNILSGFGMQATEAGRVADLMAYAASNANTDVGQLGEAMKYAAPVASSLGISIEDTAAAIGFMSDAGIQGGMAGTALRGMMIRLAAPTTGAAKAIADLGLNLYTADGALRPLPELVSEFERGMAGMTDQQRAAALQTIIGTEAIGGFNALLLRGGDALQGFSDELGRSGGTAQRMADVQMATLQGRMSSLGSAAESLQISLGTAALPALSALADGATTVVRGLDGFVQAVLANGDAIQGVLYPALIGLAAASVAYAMTTLPGLVSGVWASVTALGAQALAAAAAAAPFLALGVAVAGVTYAWNEFDGKVKTATRTLLDSREWWNDSAAALAAYGQANLDLHPSLQATAKEIEDLRTAIEADIESLGKRKSAGAISEAQYQREMDAINANADALKIATDALNTEMKAILEAEAASLTATEAAGNLALGTAGLGEAAGLTAQDVEKLGETLEQIYTERGPAALGAYAASAATMLTGVETRQAAHRDAVAALEVAKQQATTEAQAEGIAEQIRQLEASYAEQELQAATSYAAQAQAQRRHLGEILIEYTVAQRMLGNIASETAVAITKALEEEYGIQESLTGSTFLRMAGAIDAFAGDSSASLDGLIGTLRTQESAAIEAERAMTAMSKEYVATAVANFTEKGGEAADYISTLSRIPAEVVTRVVTVNVTRNEGGPSTAAPGGNMEARAYGGPVAAGTPYLVGEWGREVFVPTQPGTVLSAADLAALLRSSAQTSPPAGPQVTIYNSDIRNEERLLDLLQMQALLHGGRV